MWLNGKIIINHNTQVFAWGHSFNRCLEQIQKREVLQAEEHLKAVWQRWECTQSASCNCSKTMWTEEGDKFPQSPALFIKLNFYFEGKRSSGSLQLRDQFARRATSATSYWPKQLQGGFWDRPVYLLATNFMLAAAINLEQTLYSKTSSARPVWPGIRQIIGATHELLLWLRIRSVQVKNLLGKDHSSDVTQCIKWKTRLRC